MVYIFISSFLADNAPILTNPSSTSTDPSSFTASSFSSSPTNQLISSVEELILALPTITDPVGFGLHLGVRYNRCKQLIRNHGSDINAQVQVIAAEWYNLTSRPTWNKVVEALYNCGLVRDAFILANKVGAATVETSVQTSSHAKGSFAVQHCCSVHSMHKR